MPVIVAGVLDQYVMEVWGLIWLSRVWRVVSSCSGSEGGDGLEVVVEGFGTPGEGGMV